VPAAARCPAAPKDEETEAGRSTAVSLTDRVRSRGLATGLTAVGVAAADPFIETRAVLEARRAAGLAADMQFTYRNPARSTDPSRALSGARSLVVGARGYERDGPAVDTGDEGSGVTARVARYSWVDHYADLRRGLEAMAGELRAAGWRTVVLADDNSLVDRAAAQRAGIGWYGKNTNILLPGAGSWFVLGSVVTDALLERNAPVADGCGSCRRCLPACPTDALSEPGVLDARRCLAWLVQAPGVFPLDYRVALGDRLYGCDDCQEVCPVNRLHTRRQPPPPAEGQARAVVDALAVLAATDAELLADFGRWYLAGREVRWLRRNALLVVGNTADASRPDVVAAVRRALADPDPAVRGPAVWASARLGLASLLPEADEDPDVARELAQVPSVPSRS
jgi:epoxyqueuosine reductase